MFLLRAVVERLLAAVFRLIGTVTLLQGLGFLGALMVALAVPGRSSAPSWMTFALTRGAVIGAILTAGGMLLAWIQARSAGPAATAREGDPSLHREWVWPAAIPTLAFPVVALALSRNLIRLCQDILEMLDRIGLREEFARGGGMSGVVLMPVFAALTFPLLEVVAALSLVAIPPFLLLLLIARSRRFRMECQCLVVVQAAFVGASLVGADLFARLARLLVPHVQAAGGPEAAVVLEALERGGRVLMGTATGYAAVLAGYVVSLWVLMAVHVPRRVAWEAIAGPAPAPIEPVFEEPPRPAPAAAPPEPLEEVLARYRARKGTRAGASRPQSHVMEPVPTTESLVTRSAVMMAQPETSGSARAALRLVLVSLGVLLLGLGIWQLVAPHAHYVGADPVPGEHLAEPPAGIVVQFSHPLGPPSSITVWRAKGIAGLPELGDTAVVGAAALDPRDPTARTLRSQPLPVLGDGLYRVDWRAVPAGRRDTGYGSYYFGVGMDVPGHLLGPAGRPYQQRDAGTRHHRATLLSGVVLLFLAAFVPGRLLRG